MTLQQDVDTKLHMANQVEENGLNSINNAYKLITT